MATPDSLNFWAGRAHQQERLNLGVRRLFALRSSVPIAPDYAAAPLSLRTLMSHTPPLSWAARPYQRLSGKTDLSAAFSMNTNGYYTFEGDIKSDEPIIEQFWVATIRFNFENPPQHWCLAHGHVGSIVSGGTKSGFIKGNIDSHFDTRANRLVVTYRDPSDFIRDNWPEIGDAGVTMAIDLTDDVMGELGTILGTAAAVVLLPGSDSYA